MRSKLGRRESRALLLAALASAAALAAAGFSLGPKAFSPWALALITLLVAGLAGAVTAWVASGRPYVLPLGLLLLPFCRAALAVVRHGWPPWRFSMADWLLGDEFPIWAGAMSVAAAYAGALARCYIRVVKYGEAVLAKPFDSGSAEAWIDGEEGSTASKLVMFPFFFGAVLAGLLGVGQGIVVRFYAAAFLLAGLYLAGLVNARRRQISWQARGVETGADPERGWWRGHAAILWVLLAFLPILPGGFQPIDPRGLARRFLGTAPPPPINPRIMPRPRLPEVPSEFPQMSGWFSQIMAFVYRALSLLFILLGIGLALAALYFLLRGVVFRLKAWHESLGPLWEGIRRFCASLLALLRGALARGRDVLYRAMPGRIGRARLKNGGSHRRWPASRIRMLFARLVIWGREEGLGLPSTFAPAEFAACLAEYVPERKEDLAYLVEIYRRERYGELKPERRERHLYRTAWERVMRSGSSKTADRH